MLLVDGVLEKSFPLLLLKDLSVTLAKRRLPVFSPPMLISLIVVFVDLLLLPVVMAVVEVLRFALAVFAVVIDGVAPVLLLPAGKATAVLLA